ncbi:hypothetical protein EV126DRAFT_51401 [Verticillium dahliae]|nr:hypothetical protein EV126DRAFT_51401 [Verticillium dahliae]
MFEMGRRDSSPRMEHPRRPRLRSCVTEPSITTSNASRGAFASPQSSQRATELLTRVVVSSPTADFTREPTSQRIDCRGATVSTGSPTIVAVPRPSRAGREMSDTSPSYSDCYFSFPNFDAWDGEDDTGTKNDGIHFE